MGLKCGNLKILMQTGYL